MNNHLRALAAALTLAAAGCTVHPATAGGPRPVDARPDGAELVVLVHGMGRTPLSMLRMERSLERAGYSVLNWGYSSTCCTVRELADRLRTDISEHVADRPARVHFVGHSLGTVIIRAALNRAGAPDRVGRIVLLAPPSRGARSADLAAPLLSWLFRPLPELATGDSSTVNTIPWPAGSELAVIAGRFDAKVSVEEARVPGAGLVLLPATHSFLMLRSDAIRHTIFFLRTGRTGQER